MNGLAHSAMSEPLFFSIFDTWFSRCWKSVSTAYNSIYGCLHKCIWLILLKTIPSANVNIIYVIL